MMATARASSTTPTHTSVTVLSPSETIARPISISAAITGVAKRDQIGEYA